MGRPGRRGRWGSPALGSAPFRHYPVDPVAAENFQQKLFIPVASGPFGVLDVGAPRKLRATATSFPLLPGPASQAPSPFLLYQTEHVGQSMRGMRFLINGLTFRMDEIAFDVKRGAVEIWRISNPAVGMPHPMHIHGFSFQVLERSSSPPQWAAAVRFGKGRAVSDLGWKDTVLVWPGETVRIAIDFAHDFPGRQTCDFHCHNLEHEDAGMMINFRVQA